MKCPLTCIIDPRKPTEPTALQLDCLKAECAWYVQITTVDGYTHAGCALAILAESALDRK